MTYRLRDKEKRNERLRKFAKEHPEYTHAGVAGVFHIDRSRVTRILNRGSNDRPREAKTE